MKGFNCKLKRYTGTDYKSAPTGDFMAIYCKQCMNDFFSVYLSNYTLMA